MNATSTSSTRRYDIDWLRVMLILTVLVFHSIRFFDVESWTIKNATTYEGVQMLVVFISRWMMPAIFFISGAATFYALRKRGAGQLVKDRTLRLLVPLLVGLFTHIPLQAYLGQINQNRYSGSFWQWYPGMFSSGGDFNWLGGHLWYLEVLFVFSLVCLPLFIWLQHGSGKGLLSWLGSRLSVPAALYLPVLPLILFSTVLSPDTDGRLTGEEFGGWNIPCHLLFFLSGFVFTSSQPVQDSIRRMRWISLVAGVGVFTIGGIALVMFTNGEVSFGTPVYLVWTSISSLSCWACMLAILGFAMQNLNIHNPALDYANEAVLPFYVLHQSVLFGVAFYMIKWAIPDLAKWALILTTTFIIIMALYELLIRRINPLRVLFGMKPVYKERIAHKPAVQVS